MNYTTMKATVNGTTCEGEAFSMSLECTLVPPKDSNHYGTGYYMTIKLPHTTELIDVRYERTTDIEILADRWIESYFGQNAKEVIKQKPEMIGG